MISKMDLPKGEHRLHALAKVWRMTVPVPLRMYTSRSVCQPMVELTSWFEYMVYTKPELLLGGFSFGGSSFLVASGSLLESLRVRATDSHGVPEAFQRALPLHPVHAVWGPGKIPQEVSHTNCMRGDGVWPDDLQELSGALCKRPAADR